MRAKLWPNCDEAAFWSGKPDGISISRYTQKWAKERKKQTMILAFKMHHIKVPMDLTFKTRLQTIADRLWVVLAVRYTRFWEGEVRERMGDYRKTDIDEKYHHPARTIVTKDLAHALPQ